jgi:hypothetical protein
MFLAVFSGNISVSGKNKERLEKKKPATNT